METIKLQLTGISPLLMHSDKLANPLSKETKLHKELTSKKKKTEDDQVAISRSEWMGSIYHDKELGLFLPSQNIMTAIRNGGKINKMGSAISRATVCLVEKVALKTNAPKSLDAMWESGEFTDCRSVVVQRARLMRYRPRFNQWSTVIEIHYAPDVIDKAQLLLAADNAGRLVGVGDFRPEKSGPFGRFEVAEV